MCVAKSKTGEVGLPKPLGVQKIMGESQIVRFWGLPDYNHALLLLPLGIRKHVIHFGFY